MALRIVAVLALVLTVVTPIPAADLINGVAAEVNDEIITRLEVTREYELRLKEEGKAAPAAPADVQKLRTAALNALIDKKLIQQKVREMNVTVTEEEVRQAIEDVKKQNGVSQEGLVAALITQGMTFDQYRTQIKEQLERVRLVGQEVKAKISVSEQEVREYYDRHLGEFSEEGGFRAKSIFFRLPENASATEVRDLVTRMMQTETAVKKNADFGDLARKYSDDPNVRQDGGDIGFIKKGEMLPEIESIVTTLTPGQVSEPVSTPSGYHLLKLEEKKNATPLPFAAVKARVEELVLARKIEERFNAWTAELRKDAYIVISP